MSELSHSDGRERQGSYVRGKWWCEEVWKLPLGQEGSYEHICRSMCFMRTFTSQSFGPLLWVIVLSQTGEYSPLPERCLIFWSKLCCPLEEERRVREKVENGGRVPMERQCGECGVVGQWADFTLFLQLCAGNCFQLTPSRDLYIVATRLAASIASSTVSCFGKQPLFFILHHSYSRTKNFVASPPYSPTKQILST